MHSLLTLLAWVMLCIFGYLILRLMALRSRGQWTRYEMIGLSLIIGMVVFPYLLGYLAIVGVPLSLSWYLIILAMGSLLSCGAYRYFTGVWHRRWEYESIGGSFWNSWKAISLVILAILMGIKFALASYSLLITPTYVDDTVYNWNTRGKIFYTQESLVLDPTSPDYLGRGFKQYPLTVPLLKSYLAKINNNWHDGVVNSHAPLAAIAIILIMFGAILRETRSKALSLAGPIALMSVPIAFIHATAPYNDLLTGGLFLLAIYALIRYLRSEISIIETIVLVSLLGAVKNEGLIIFTTAAFFGALCFGYSKSVLLKVTLKKLMPIIGGVTLIHLPFIIFRIVHNLGFGNGDAAISQTAIVLHTEILLPLFKFLFFSSNYNLLWWFFVGSIVLLLTNKKRWTQEITGLLWAFFMGFIGIFLVYFLTSAAQFVINETGIHRSMVQLIPLAIFSTLLITHQLLRK